MARRMERFNIFKNFLAPMPRVITTFNSENLGSCLGRNLLLQHATGKLWFIIDDDATFQFKDDLRKASLEFEKHPRAGAIGFTVVNANDPKTLNLWISGQARTRAQHKFRSAQFASTAPFAFDEKQWK